jgi:cobalt-zinc-cadmium efflux system protein
MEHTPSPSSRLTIAIALQTALVVLQLVVSTHAHSTALAADAGHNLVDIATLLLTLSALRIALRPASPTHSFGNHRAAVLAALANTTLIAAVTVLITISATHRLLHPLAVHPTPVIIAAALGLVLNAIAALLVHHGHGHDLNLRAAALHLTADALASLAVLVSAVLLIAYPQATWLDPTAALLVALVIVVQATRVLSASVAILWQSTPTDIDPVTLAAAIADLPGVDSAHDLHIWSLTPDLRILTAHLVLSGHPTLEQAQAIAAQVKRAIEPTYKIAHSTLELECEYCDDDPDHFLAPSR